MLPSEVLKPGRRDVANNLSQKLLDLCLDLLVKILIDEF
jgi:hypothetical protein